MATEPPLNVPESMKGKERIIPGGRNYYTDPTKIITSVDIARNYPIGRDQEEDVRTQIRDIFRSQIFALLRALEQQKVQTATWVRQVAAEEAIVLGPMVGRFSGEFQIPLVRRTYQILLRSGLMPPPPPVLAGGARAKVEFQGPLALALRRFHQSQGTTAGLEFLAGIVQLYPDALDNADGDELAREGMDAAGMPQRVIREVPDVQRMRKQRAEAMAREQEAAAAAGEQELVAQNAEKLNQPIKPGSMMERVMGARGQRRPAPAGAGGRR
jgi:hypothetical protein